MSHDLKLAVKITDMPALDNAVKALQAQGMAYSNLEYQQDVDRRGQDGKISGWAVKLPGWVVPCVFACDAQGDCSIDNYSKYIDNRNIDEAGNRINGTGEVHPLILSGEKNVGDDGQWGEIRYLHRLQAEYQHQLVLLVAAEVGDSVYNVQSNADGSMELRVEHAY